MYASSGCNTDIYNLYSLLGERFERGKQEKQASRPQGLKASQTLL